MRTNQSVVQDIISRISSASWKAELEQVSSRYHLIAAWAAIIFDPLFAITDYFNIPENWSSVFILRLSIAAITLVALMIRREYDLPSFVIVVIPFVLISLQNAYTYSLIGNANLLGHNLNYIALLIGAALFLLWHWIYSTAAIFISVLATAYFIKENSLLSIDQFFIEGGLLLIASAVFMIVLIKTRYDLNVKEIKTRLALIESKHEIQTQAEEIRMINDNLESLVKERTIELEKKNKALEEYAFINAHKLRSPVASVLGLVNLLAKVELTKEGREILSHMDKSANHLNAVVETITQAIERGDRGPLFRERNGAPKDEV
jgi:signal transduction histidine kinase